MDESERDINDDSMTQLQNADRNTEESLESVSPDNDTSTLREPDCDDSKPDVSEIRHGGTNVGHDEEDLSNNDTEDSKRDGDATETEHCDETVYSQLNDDPENQKHNKNTEGRERNDDTIDPEAHGATGYTKHYEGTEHRESYDGTGDQKQSNTTGDLKQSNETVEFPIQTNEMDVPKQSNETVDPKQSNERQNPKNYEFTRSTFIDDVSDDYQSDDEFEASLIYGEVNDSKRNDDGKDLWLVDPRCKNSSNAEQNIDLNKNDDMDPSSLVKHDDDNNAFVESDIADLTYDPLGSGETEDILKELEKINYPNKGLDGHSRQTEDTVTDKESTDRDDLFSENSDNHNDDGTKVDDIESVTYMLNSEEYYDDSENSLSLTTANVSGFSEVKHKSSLDYLFILEVMWSDGRSVCVKRTYKDFLIFRKTLVEYFQKKSSDDDIERDPVFIPNLTGLKLFKRYDRALAEEREMELQEFMKNLLNGNPMVSTAVPVLEFFEPKATDPIPYRGCPDGDDSAEEEDPFAEEVFSLRWIRGEKS